MTKRKFVCAAFAACLALSACAVSGDNRSASMAAGEAILIHKSKAQIFLNQNRRMFRNMAIIRRIRPIFYPKIRKICFAAPTKCTLHL